MTTDKQNLQMSKDRAKYGDKLLIRLAEQLDDKSFSLASLKNYRQFYLYYPEIARPVADYLQHKAQKSQSLISLFQQQGNQRLIKSQSLISFSDESQSDIVSKDGVAIETANGNVMEEKMKEFLLRENRE